MDDLIRQMPNKYYEFFKSQIGHGDTYYPDIGHIYQFQAGTKRLGYGYGLASSMGQRGLGFGSFFASLFRRAVPLLRRGATRAVSLAADIAKEALEGQNIKESAIKHLKSAGEELVENIPAIGKVIRGGGGVKRKKSKKTKKKSKKRKENPAHEEGLALMR